jgi:superfamily II DNA/RNA helicase
MTEEKSEKKNFKEYNLKFELLRGLYISGYEEPTNIQKKNINRTI